MTKWILPFAGQFENPPGAKSKASVLFGGANNDYAFCSTERTTTMGTSEKSRCDCLCHLWFNHCALETCEVEDLRWVRRSEPRLCVLFGGVNNDYGEVVEWGLSF